MMKKFCWILFYLLITACVDPIKFDVPLVAFQLVVDGLITDEPGPYTVSLSRARALDADLSTRVPVFGAKVTILSDVGESEALSEGSEYGTFKTKLIQGKVGRSYHIKITTADGKIYESLPEKMAPVGEVAAVNFEFEKNTMISNGIEVPSNRFNIYTDGKVVPGNENYVRWRLVGTYEVETFPQLIRSANPAGALIPNPPACSGYAYRNSQLVITGPCTCCYCWITDYGLPAVSDDQLVSGGLFKNVRVGSVPITRRTFYDKYYVEVQQMALTKEAFTFWKLVRAQKDGANSLFQPPLAKLKSNVSNLVNSEEQVQGYFAAASIKKRGIFITRADIPYGVSQIDTLATSCLFGSSSTNIKPSFWK